MGNERDADLPLCAIQDAPETQVSEMSTLLCHQPPCQGEAALTFVAVAHRVEVDVVLVAAEEEEAEPGVEGIDGHDEEDADDVALLLGNSVIPQVCVDLQSARCARAVATTGQEGNQKYPQPTGLQGGSSHVSPPPGGESTSAFPPQTHRSEQTCETGSIPVPGAIPSTKTCGNRVPSPGLCKEGVLLPASPCAAPSQCSESPACPRATFGSTDLCGTQKHAHWQYVSRQPVVCAPKTQTPGWQMRNPTRCCLQAVPMPCSLSWLWQPFGEHVGKVQPPELPAPGSQPWR